ncbi:hypothetical protein CSPX01_11034 [Colletotrichum filicis]|nr:hypothetical protein CSPX01_11034 [Colletotrichum filicis]
MGTYSLGWQSLHYRDSTAAGGNYLVTRLLAKCFATSEHAQASSSGYAYSKADRDANEQYTTPNSYDGSQQSPRASSQAPFIQSQSISSRIPTASLEQYMIPHPPKSQGKASETEKAQPLAIGYAHTESAPLTNGNHSQPAETLLSLSNKGIAVGYGSKAEASSKSVATVWPITSQRSRSNATSAVAFAFVPSFRIPRTVDASSPPMPANKTATWDTGVVDAIELKMRQDLGKSDSWRRGQSDALVNQVNKLLLETGLMGHRQVPETMTVKTMVPLSAEIVPSPGRTLKGSHPVRPKQQHPLRGEQHRDLCNLLSSRSLHMECRSVTVAVAPHQPQHPVFNSQFPDFLTSRFSSPPQLATPSASLVGNSIIVSGLISPPPP